MTVLGLRVRERAEQDLSVVLEDNHPVGLVPFADSARGLHHLLMTRLANVRHVRRGQQAFLQPLEVEGLTALESRLRDRIRTEEVAYALPAPATSMVNFTVVYPVWSARIARSLRGMSLPPCGVCSRSERRTFVRGAEEARGYGLTTERHEVEQDAITIYASWTAHPAYRPRPLPSGGEAFMLLDTCLRPSLSGSRLDLVRGA